MPPLVLAETASVFAEIVLTRHLLAEAKDQATRRAILCDVLQDIYGTVFRQTALTRFEIAAHAKRQEGILSPDEIGNLWWNEQAKLFGDSVEMLPISRWGWSYIPHFIHSRFYCYSYSFGELLTLALFQRYLDEGEAFIPTYLPGCWRVAAHSDLNTPSGGSASTSISRNFGIGVSRSSKDF